MAEYWNNTDLKDIDGEIWKPIPDCALYLASNYGRIKQLPSYINYLYKGKPFKRYIPERICKQYINKNPNRYNYTYLTVYMLHLPKSSNQKKVSKCVYSAFNNLIINDYVVNHIDNNQYNNSISNLEMVSQRDNLHHFHLNRKKRTTNYMGVCKHKRSLTKKYVSHLNLNNKKYYLGYFHNPKVAHAWYLHNLEIRQIECKYL